MQKSDLKVGFQAVSNETDATHAHKKTQCNTHTRKMQCTKDSIGCLLCIFRMHAHTFQIMIMLNVKYD